MISRTLSGAVVFFVINGAYEREMIHPQPFLNSFFKHVSKKVIKSYKTYEV